MTIYERMTELQNNTDLQLENAKDTYYQSEFALVDLVGDYVTGQEVICQAYGSGRIVSYRGTTLDNIIVAVAFATTVKSFSLQHIIEVARFVKFADILEIGVMWEAAKVVHTDLTNQFKELESLSRQLEFEAKKKAEADKKAEAKYQAVKEKAIQDFDTCAKAVRPTSNTDEFYYALGWLAKHTGTVSAALPDYLETSFIRHFGSEAPRRVVDSKKRYPSGWTAQWTWAFTIPFKKPKQLGTIPVFLSDKLNPTGKAVSDTSFVWDLIDNYGFQFGKTQDLDKIRACVPVEYITFFEAGFVS